MLPLLAHRVPSLSRVGNMCTVHMVHCSSVPESGRFGYIIKICCNVALQRLQCRRLHCNTMMMGRGADGVDAMA
jgi:hypothetical protein